jgi:Ca2+-binding EF-hand superfamily protein
MGCGGSSSLPKSGESELDFDFLSDYLSLSRKEISTLHRAFRKVDVRNSGMVEFDEFCARLKCEPTLFLESMFGFFSSARNGNFIAQNFSEFALFSCFFLTLDEAGLAEYLYVILVSTDGNAHLSQKDLLNTHNMEHNVFALFGKAMGDRDKVHKWMKKMDADKNGHVSCSEFVSCCLKHKSLLFPVVRYQMDMREAILNPSFWTKRSGLGNKILPTIREIRDDLHNLLRDQRRQLRHPDLADGELVRSSQHLEEPSAPPSDAEDDDAEEIIQVEIDGDVVDVNA